MSEASESDREAIWKSKLEADRSVQYWSIKTRKYYKRLRCFEVVLGFTTSGVVATWLGSWVTSFSSATSWSYASTIFGYLWKVIILISAGIAIILPSLGWLKKVEDMSKLTRKWLQIRSKYEILWLDYERGRNLDEIIKEYQHIKSTEPLADQESPDLPGEDDELWDKCFYEVVASLKTQNQEGINEVEREETIDSYC